ncbi:MAG TPA: UPF0149 family protein [Sphingomicrobium sp.]|nr:UPF0149 family protein [Sphingomicrobium sp.]
MQLHAGKAEFPDQSVRGGSQTRIDELLSWKWRKDTGLLSKAREEGSTRRLDSVSCFSRGAGNGHATARAQRLLHRLGRLSRYGPAEPVLEMLWGHDEPTFDNTEQVQKVLDSVMTFHNATLEKIDSKGADWQPMYMDASGKADLSKADTWAFGFWEAISLDPEAWEELAQDERTQILVETFILLMDVGEFDDETDPNLTDEIRRGPQANSGAKAKRRKQIEAQEGFGASGCTHRRYPIV